MSLTQERLRDLLIYEPETGIFRWRIDLPGRGGSVKAGKIAGSIDTKGRRQIKIDRTIHFAHRLVFLWMLGRWPADMTDHIDRDFTNNRWCNLREANARESATNREYRSTKGKLRGAYQCASGKYRAMYLGKYLGTFPTEREAHNAYLNALSPDRKRFLPIAYAR